MSEGGSVPDLRVANLGDLPLLLLDGEQRVGAFSSLSTVEGERAG